MTHPVRLLDEENGGDEADERAKEQLLVVGLSRAASVWDWSWTRGGEGAVAVAGRTWHYA